MEKQNKKQISPKAIEMYRGKKQEKESKHLEQGSIMNPGIRQEWVPPLSQRVNNYGPMGLLKLSLLLTGKTGVRVKV